MTKRGKRFFKILFCAGEVAPFSKTGGLADVAGSLPTALGEMGHEVLISTPKYRGIRVRQKKLGQRVSIHFIEHPTYFDREGLYGDERGDYPDNLDRFAAYCRRTLELIREKNFRPDIIHNNDWQTALIPIDLRTVLKDDPFYRGIKTLFTVHNMAYQGLFPLDEFGPLGLPGDVLSPGGIAFYGKGSFLKGGLVYSDMVSTVSRTYSKEIRTKAHGCGLEEVLRRRSRKLASVLNGIDTRLWDPARDTKIKRRYSWKNIERKLENKKDLQKICALERNPRAPLFGMVTRLVEQKGMDLILQALDSLMKLGIQFVLLGTGDPKYHRFFGGVQAKYRGAFSANLRFDALLAQKVYAGSDFFLMPSRFEPCGLGQMISFRYGTIPVAHRVGGLADTIVDAGRGLRKGNGFLFSPFQAERLLNAVERALHCYRDVKNFQRMQQRVMRLDFSWKKAAADYNVLYRRLCGAC